MTSVLDEVETDHVVAARALVADRLEAGSWTLAATAPGLIPDGGTRATPAADADTRTIGQRRHDAAVEAFRQALGSATLPTSGGIIRGSWSPSLPPACPVAPVPDD